MFLTELALTVLTFLTELILVKVDVDTSEGGRCGGRVPAF
jgi:hypothetical protein